MNIEEDEDDKFLEETKRLHSSKSNTFMTILANIPIVGWILGYIIGFIAQKIADVKRRRRSYKFSLYFQAQMLLGLGGFLLFLIIPLVTLSWLSDPSKVEAECQIPSTFTMINGTTVSLYDSSGTFLNVGNHDHYLDSTRHSVLCENEDSDWIDAACDLTDMKLLLHLMIALSISFSASMVVSVIVYSGFNFFSNIPMESLDISVTSCKVTFLGAACRHGPWIQKLLTLVTIGIVLTLVFLPSIDSLCLGSTTKTHKCVHGYDDCVDNAFRNCRYYFSDHCVGTGLPHAASQSSKFESCKNHEVAERFSGRYDVRLVFPTVCSRCWALDADCKVHAINSLRFTANQSSTEFVYDTSKFSVSPVVPDDDPMMGRQIYCRCVQGLDNVDTTTGNILSLNFDPQRLTRGDTDCSSGVDDTTCPDTLIGVREPDVFDDGASYWSTHWTDEVAGTSPIQHCDWGPQDHDIFAYMDEECGQPGSFINRYVFVSSYVTTTLIVLLIVIGITLQTTIQSETWSYSPQRKDEPWYWRIIRFVGPG